MKIRQIFQSEYPNNKKEVLEYTSDFYYHLTKTKKLSNKGWTFDWEKKPFKSTYKKIWEGVFFEPYKTNAEYYVLEDDNGKEIGVLVFEHLNHSKRTRIWDIMVHTQYLRQGYGTYLLQFVEENARKKGQRSLVLECQNTNTKAVDFYIRNGFELVGFDLEAYTEEQGNGIEVRFEMGKKFI
jgi:ribosomal protein S18 acetylase RimI-like enzyme